MIQYDHVLLVAFRPISQRSRAAWVLQVTMSPAFTATGFGRAKSIALQLISTSFREFLAAVNLRTSMSSKHSVHRSSLRIELSIDSKNSQSLLVDTCDTTTWKLADLEPFRPATSSRFRCQMEKPDKWRTGHR